MEFRLWQFVRLNHKHIEFLIDTHAPKPTFPARFQGARSAHYMPRLPFGPSTIDMKTFSAKAQDQTRQWYIIDAKDQILGDVAVTAANILRGKNKPIFTPHVDTGDHVVVINASEVRLTGRKETQKQYMSVSGYVGREKRESVERVRERRPQLLVERAVKGMIPHNSLGRQIFTKLRVYPGAEHPHEAHSPKAVAIA
jgi:large subunit ribosomal protein L13